MQSQPDLDSTLGSLFIAFSFSTMLYGVTCAQCIYYTRHYFRRDNTLVKGLVSFIWILDTAATITDLYMFWWFTIRSHTNVFDLLSFPKLFELEYATISMISFVVQIFYIHQLWQLSKTSSRNSRLIINALPMALSLLCLVLGFVAIYDVAVSDWIITRTLGTIRVPLTIRVCASAAVDVYISIALTWVLRKKKTGIRQTDSMINTQTVYIMNRGILTAVLQIVFIGMYLGASENQDQLEWVIPYCIGGKVYINSMMAVLNARDYLRDGLFRHDVELSLRI